MNYSTYTATPDLVKATGILDTMLKQEKFFPTFEWNDRDETDGKSYLVWDTKSEPRDHIQRHHQAILWPG